MLITLSYLYLWARFHRCYAALIRNTLSRLQQSRLCFSFSLCSSSASATPFPRYKVVQHRPSPPLEEQGLFLQLGDKAVYVTEPQACGDLSKWTVLFGSPPVCAPCRENISFIIEATGPRVGCRSSRETNKKVLKWSDYCRPLACCPGQPYRVVAQTTVDNFSRLGVAFIEDRLQLDDGFKPSKIVPVLLQESTLIKLLKKHLPQSPWTNPSSELALVKPSPFHLCVDEQHLCRKGSFFLAPEAKTRLEERRGSEPICRTQDLGLVCDSEEHSSINHHHMEEHGHHLHLSSCNECLELENSTILSVKYASAENIPDLPDDNSVGLLTGDETLDELEQDHKDSLNPSCGLQPKPPNILVYTDGNECRFQVICQVLSRCINIDNYMIYQLQPQQALSDPWLDNTRLLVVAEETSLSPHLQTRFLTYLSRGGRVLGLASSLCPAGLSLGAQKGTVGPVSTLSFTREDNSSLELNVLISGKVFIRDVQGGGEVELWGELKGDGVHHSNMVIVRVTHGDDGGEAVLCQVHLEKAPDCQTLTSESSDQLQTSNALRYEVLTEILSSLGLSCALSQLPTPSPIHLLATSQEEKSHFENWLKTQVDSTGILILHKLSIRMVSCSDGQRDPVPPDTPLPFLMNSSESPCPKHFSMKIYDMNLKTTLLGRTVLYAEVASSTMDLLEGLNLRIPSDVGLIAVAARQSQGRGRSKNGWLSPIGCAMFTVSVQVELGSWLGQRIPFLQHLAALAVVEAVRTLPGYEDIDLRLKWPNDIYYSSLIKLGGVLVTSTVLGSTFHLLIGCGFNVTNSNPTMCINDIIEQYNREHSCSLQPLCCAQLIARAVSFLEGFISSFQREGPDAVLPTYYKRWLHSGTQVRLWNEDGPEAEVVGLDQNGFLQVHSPQQGLVSVEPDGNSFDMLKNLVVIKQH